MNHVQSVWVTLDAFTLLLPLSWLYRAAVAIRNKSFDWGIRHSTALGAPTVSVGNLTVGGTGKTPLVAYIVRYLVGKGKRVAVLSRGYSRKSTGFVLVSDGENILTDALTVGDEPYELAQDLHGAILAVDEKRARAGKIVLQRFPVDVFILDDGFQHRGVKRDLDVVTITGRVDRASDDRGEFNSRLLPAGRFREPFGSLKRADHIVLTGVRGEGIARVENDLGFYRRYTSADASAVRARVRAIVRLWDRKEENQDKFVGKSAFVFCGIANPGQFFRFASSCGFMVVGQKAFADHHWYRGQDLLDLQRQFQIAGGSLLLTTMKDAARFSGSPEGRAFTKEFPVYGLAIELQFVQGEDAFRQHLDRLVA
jgi:tetraacyldisaccharide 4'-kinase